MKHVFHVGVGRVLTFAARANSRFKVWASKAWCNFLSRGLTNVVDLMALSSKRTSSLWPLFLVESVIFYIFKRCAWWYWSRRAFARSKILNGSEVRPELLAGKREKMKRVFHVSFFGIRENRRSSKSAETFQKKASGDTDHGEPLYGQKY